MRKHIIHSEFYKLLKTLKPEVHTFITDLVSKCDQYDISFRAYHKASYKQCQGWFNHGDRLITICTKSKPETQYDWVANLIHESCHMDQWIEGAKVFKKWDIAPDILSHVKGKTNLTKDEIDRSIRAYQAIELDCERRTVAKIEKYGLTHLINMDRYIRMANFYIYTYETLKYTGKWPKTKRPDEWNYKMWSGLPNKLLRSYKKLPEGFLEEIKTMI